MRASELVGARVRTRTGTQLGWIHGLYCTLDGSSDGPIPAPRLRALVITSRRFGASLGYQQQSQRGPWLIGAMIRRLHRDRSVIDWSHVLDVTDDGVVVVDQ